MKLGSSATAGVLAMLGSVLLLWLMGVNFMGWLGMWFAPGAAWLVGILFTAAFGAGLGVLWADVISKQPAVRKMPKPAGGLVYGICVALLFIFIVPLLFAAIAGDPSVGLSSGTGFDALPEAFGAHLVPALPDLGFDPPLHGLADKDWWSRDDFTGRLLPFGLAFALFGILAQLLGKQGK